MVQVCCLCDTRGKGHSYYPFPKDEKLLKIWKNICNFGDSVDVSYTVICDEHFQKRDFIIYNKKIGDVLKHLTLKSTSLPTLRIPNVNYLIKVIGQIFSGEIEIAGSKIIEDDNKDFPILDASNVIELQPENNSKLHEAFDDFDFVNNTTNNPFYNLSNDEVITVQNNSDDSLENIIENGSSRNCQNMEVVEQVDVPEKTSNGSSSIKVHVLDLDNYVPANNILSTSLVPLEKDVEPKNADGQPVQYTKRGHIKVQFAPKYFYDYTYDMLQKHPKLLPKAIERGNLEIRNLRKKVLILSQRNKRLVKRNQKLKTELGRGKKKDILLSSSSDEFDNDNSDRNDLNQLDQNEENLQIDG